MSVVARRDEAAIAGLVARAQGGDRDAFDALYEHVVGRVYGLCRRMSDDARQAEELTQDVFVRAWERLDAFRGESAFTTWLHAVAVNVVLADRRGRKRLRDRLRLETDERAPVAAAAPRESPGERVDLERAIAALPPGARLVLVLHEIHGYTHEEIAAMTGSAVGTLRAQLHRARKLLRERLA